MGKYSMDYIEYGDRCFGIKLKMERAGETLRYRTSSETSSTDAHHLPMCQGFPTLVGLAAFLNRELPFPTPSPFDSPCLTQKIFDLFFVRAGRIELPSQSWQDRVLPLNHARISISQQVLKILSPVVLAILTLSLLKIYWTHQLLLCHTPISLPCFDLE